MEKPEFSKAFISKMIAVAKDYRSMQLDVVQKLPSTFESVQSGCKLLEQALLFEAKLAMQDTISASNEPLLSCVDLHTSNPGLVTEYESEANLVVTYQDGSEVRYNNIHDLNLYQSPVPFERHIGALSQTSLCPLMQDVVLKGQLPKMPTVKVLKEMCKDAGVKVSGLKQELVDRLTGVGRIPCFTLYHGPPGTGKTFTILSRLREMLSSFPPSHRFLVCAPSNVAVVNLYTRAREWGITGSLVMREDKIPDGTHISDEEKERWDHSKDRLVFCTVSTRCGSKLKKHTFNTVIMDEAAQCQEAWAWGVFREGTTNVILAGDPHQLPAQVSQEGVELGHSKSLMERLMELGYKSILLNTQRRMHPEIVKFPNAAFYENALGTEFDTHKSNPNIKPYEAITIEAPEEACGTSFANPIEAKVVVSLVKKFKQHYNDIVVISPYKAQCELLQKLDQSLVVHTVDSFQGKEADVVILTTVRCGKTVGFWRDNRRLNVALTRAKHAMRIVGSINTWKKGFTTMEKLARDCTSRNLTKSIGSAEMLSLGIHIPLNQALVHCKSCKWGVPFVSSRAVEASRKSTKLEYHLSRALLKLALGTKQNTHGIVHTLKEDDVLVDWNVAIEEQTKTLRLQVHNVRLAGTQEDTFTTLCKSIEKQGPEWNVHCVYHEGPKTLDELPFKGKRWVPPPPEPARDRARERLQAQAFVSSLRR